jgi:hypothetical protein
MDDYKKTPAIQLNLENKLPVKEVNFGETRRYKDNF